MTRRDLFVGARVYHAIFPHWGEGYLLRVRERDLFGYKVAARYEVFWHGLSKEGKNDSVWMRASELRKTFNAKKVAMMRRLGCEVPDA